MPSRSRFQNEVSGGGGGGGNANVFPYTITCDGVTTVFDITHTLGTTNLTASIAQSETDAGVAPFYVLTINPEIVDANTVRYNLDGYSIDAGFKYQVLLTALA